MSNPPFNLKFLANRIDISGSLHTKGRTTVDESLIVGQAVHANSLRITKGIIGDKNLSVGGKSTFNDDVSMNGHLAGKDASFNNITVQNQFLWGTLDVADIKVTHDISCSKLNTNQVYSNDICGNNFTFSGDGTIQNLEVKGILKNDTFELPDNLIADNLTIREKLDVSENTIMNDISATNLELSGNLIVDGTTDLSGHTTMTTANISGHTTMTDISATNLDLSGNFRVDGMIDISGSLVITDDQIQMTPSTSHTVTIAAASDGVLNITTFDEAGTAADVNLTADGQIVYSANDASGHIFDISGTNQLSIVDGAIVPTNDNDIDLGTSSSEFKDAYFDGTVTTDALVADTADINGGDIDGTAIGATTAAAGTFTAMVGNSLSVTGATTLGTTLSVDGATTLGSNLAVTGATTLGSTLSVDGATTLGSTLKVTGATTLGSTLSVDGATTLGSNLAVTGAITCTSLNINGQDVEPFSEFIEFDADGTITCTSLNAGTGRKYDTGITWSKEYNENTTATHSHTYNDVELISWQGYSHWRSGDDSVSTSTKTTLTTGSETISTFANATDSDAKVTIYGNTIGCEKILIHSDKRIKDNIYFRNLTKSLERIMKLKVCGYHNLKHGRSDVGLIAQEVEKISQHSIYREPRMIIDINDEVLQYTITNDKLSVISENLTSNIMFDTSKNPIKKNPILEIYIIQNKQIQCEYFKMWYITKENDDVNGSVIMENKAIIIPIDDYKDELDKISNKINAVFINKDTKEEETCILNTIKISNNLGPNKNSFITCYEPTTFDISNCELYIEIPDKVLTVEKTITETISIEEGINNGKYLINFKEELTTIIENDIMYYINGDKLNGGSINNNKEYLDSSGNKTIYDDIKLEKIDQVISSKITMYDVLSVNYRQLFCLNIAATQEHNKMITNNETEIETLKTENESLKTEVASLKSTFDSVLARLSALEGN